MYIIIYYICYESNELEIYLIVDTGIYDKRSHLHMNISRMTPLSLSLMFLNGSLLVLASVNPHMGSLHIITFPLVCIDEITCLV